ncbi:MULTISPECIES: type II secretion system F family protein [unclassified Bradyrhizobium]|uniref:type II secretion system F family protein n=1 Tax=unclassified Bradyrhizobium TaxID=2631580 RepID=UPI0028E60F4C|nr:MULTISPECIES: type II secretion system F family protein [unclassified Bradyrhizobium]
MSSVIGLALVLLLIGVVALTAALLMSRRTRLETERRVNLITGERETSGGGSALGELLKVRTRKFDAQVRRIFTIGIKYTWAMRSGSLKLLLIAALSAGGMWLLTRQLLGFSPLLAVAVSAAASFFAPRFLLSREQKQTERKFVDLFPDAVDTVARTLRAGLPITAAMRTVAVDGSPPVSTVFGLIADDLRIGVPLEETLETSSREIGLPEFRFFTVAMTLQYVTGGNLTATLEILSDIIRKRRAARLKAKAATGEIRITAYTLGAIPILTTGALLVVQPRYLIPLWTDPRGHLILALAGALLLLSFLTMRRMMRSVTDA